MKQNVNGYVNNKLAVTPENIHIHISMLFEKAAILLVKSQEEYVRGEFMAYSTTIQKVINILVSLLGILDPNDVKAAYANPNEIKLQPNPWDNYFMAIFISIKDITLKGDKSKLQMLIKSLKDVSGLWEQAGRNSSEGKQPQMPTPQSAELTLSC